MICSYVYILYVVIYIYISDGPWHAGARVFHVTTVANLIQITYTTRQRFLAWIQSISQRIHKKINIPSGNLTKSYG